MKIVAVADLHGRLPDIPPCDVLILAGDTAPDFIAPGPMRRGIDADYARVRQWEWLDASFRAWEAKQPAKYIFKTPGNHDWFQKLPDGLRTRLLIDESATVPDEDTGVDVTLYGTPWVPPCGDWNYQAGRSLRQGIFDEIPAAVDILIAHSPAHMVGDRCHSGDRIGCSELRAAIQRKRPRAVFFGHCHEGYRDGREYRLGDTTLYHCSYYASLPFISVDFVNGRVKS